MINAIQNSTEKVKFRQDVLAVEQGLNDKVASGEIVPDDSPLKHYFSPVDEEVKELFIKANWIPIMNKINKDLTSDYCHKVFHKNLIKTYPETRVEVDKSTLIELIYIMD